MNLLVVEDEMLVAHHIAQRLEMAGFKVPAIVDNAQDCYEQMEKEDIDLVILDINLQGKEDGIQIGKKIIEKYKKPIIYVTAQMDKTTLNKALATHPAAYITKPFKDQDLLIAVELALENYKNQLANAPAAAEGSTSEGATNEYYVLTDSIFIKNRSRFERVPFSKITWLEASGNYTYLVTTEQRIILSANISTVCERLNYPALQRVHRSYVVNLQHVTGFDDSHVFVGNHEIPLSKNYREEFIKHIHTL
ncbi:MAG: response regulator [Bacteroidia bacterium]|nr:response regulator [Bacteroidia bacterium]MDW8157585.1 response regulator [Bacteroidia bacterium]